MKYAQDIDDLLRYIFYEDGMDENEYKNLVDSALIVNGISKQLLSEQIEIGVKNGHSVELQILLLKHLLNKTNK